MATILSRPFNFAMKFINKCILVRLKRVQVLEPVYFCFGGFLHKHKIFEEFSLRGFSNCSNSCVRRASNITRVNKQMRDGNSEILLLKVRTDSVSV